MVLLMQVPRTTVTMMIVNMDDSDDNDGGDEDSHGSGDAENDHDNCASGPKHKEEFGYLEEASRRAGWLLLGAIVL